MIDIQFLQDSSDLKSARRIRKYVLLYCSSGSLVISVDENEFTLQKNDVITITSGQIHYVKQSNNAKGYILEFTYDFFCKDDKDIELIFHNSLFCHFAMNEVIQLGKDQSVEQKLVQIQKELTEKPYQYMISTHSLVELILVEINRAKVQRGDEIWKPDALFLKFLEKIRANFEHNYSLSQFAKMLNITEAKLNEQSKLHTGRTAQSVIYGLIASEAKRILIYENLSVKEVAYKLGFNDPFYFSNFFKKHAGVSPKSYQLKHAL